MKPFWEAHSSEMRKARLLAASAIIYSAGRTYVSSPKEAVSAALELEDTITHFLKETKEKE